MKKILIIFCIFIVGLSNGWGLDDAILNHSFSDQGKRVVLCGNKTNGKNVLTQSMFRDGGNAVFVIKYDFILSEDITIPANSVLKFEGGSVSKHGFKGKIANETLNALWFKDSESLLYSINHLTGYKTIELKRGRKYLFDDVIAPICSVVINGNNATIGRSDIKNNISKPLIHIDAKTRIESVTFKNIIFDGGAVPGLPVEVNYHQNMVAINNVAKVESKNVRFEHFCPPYQSGVSPSNDFVNIAQYNSVIFDGVVFKKNILYGEVVNLFPAGGNATPTTNVANDKVKITNSIFDFRGGRCYSVVNCYGGILDFRNNEIYGCIGALNAYVHDSYIVGNIYADAQSGFVDLSEQGQYYSRNVTISGNTIKNISKFNHPVYGKNSTHLLECYGAEDITVVNNTYEPTSTGTEADGAGYVFALSDGTKNVLIKKNRILCNGQLYGNVMGAPNENIQFVDNFIYQGHRSIYGLIRLNKEKGISFVRNTFEVSHSENEKITGALVFIDKEGQILDGFVFSRNKMNCAVSVPMFVYVGKGDYPTLQNWELVGNKASGGGIMPATIRNKGETSTILKNNRGMQVVEENVQ